MINKNKVFPPILYGTSCNWILISKIEYEELFKIDEYSVDKIFYQDSGWGYYKRVEKE